MIASRPRVGMHCLTFWLLFVSWSPLALAASPCTNEQLGRLIPKAQRLDRDALALYQNLADCREENIRDHALQWISFYLVMTGDTEGPRKLEVRTPGSLFTDHVKRDIDAARHGDYQSLKRGIGSSVSGYYDSPPAQLTLGRALMRAGKYDEAFGYYRNYLRIKPEDDLISVELLYAYIWGGDLENAQSYFHILSSYKISPFLQISLDNATWVMDAVKSAQRAGAQAPAADTGSMRFQLEEHKESVGFERQSLGFAYRGAVQFALARHRLTSTVYAGAAHDASECSAAYQLALTKNLAVDGLAGYFATSSGQPFGRIGMLGSIGDLTYETGFKIEPLALVYPMTADDLALMRNSGFFRTAYQKWLTFHALLAKDDSYSPFERYELGLAIPLAQKNGEESSLGLIFPVSYEHHPKPGPFSRTYPQSQSLGAGLALRRQMQKRWQTSLDATYHMITRNSFGEPKRTDFADRFVVDLGLTYPVHEDLSLGIRGLYDFEKQEGGVGESWKTEEVLSWIEYRL